jgi:hypothetical protein
MLVVEGDAEGLLARSVPPGSVAQVVMSFPEPHGPGALATKAGFLLGAHRALAPGGQLTIVTDQRSVYEGAVKELESAALKKRFRLVSRSSAEQKQGVEGSRTWDGFGKGKGGGADGRGVLPKGWEGGGGSFFNGLWVSRGFNERYFLSYAARKDEGV